MQIIDNQLFIFLLLLNNKGNLETDSVNLSIIDY